MATRCCLLVTLWVLTLASGEATAGRGKERKEGRTNVLLQEAVRQLLGIGQGVNGTPEARSSGLPHYVDLRPPKYILDLYEKYKYSDFDRGQLRGNTVRSIHASIGEVNGEAMFLFNMSSVRPTEKVLSAEIHLYKRKRRSRKSDIDVVLYEIAPHYLSENGKITMRNSAYGWQWYDVTDAVLSCLAARRMRPHLFALSFRAHKGNGKTKEVALKKFARHHSMPFLILYSNETTDINLDQMDKLAEALKSQRKHDAELETRGKTEDASSGIPATDVSKDSSHEPKAEAAEGVQAKRRVKRSVFTNEIPEDPADYKRFDYRFNLPQTHPGMLQARRESRHELSDHRLIPYPSEKRRRRRRRKHRRRNRKRNRKNRNRRLKFPEEWEDFHDNVAAPENNLSELCGRRKLIVDFADIGWGEWIISPKSFEAHYCAGTCPFPLTKRLRPSNHATIQSIVNAIGLYEHVPPPCCVPDAMSSVTLLYFDEDRNVVLKNYPSMTVQACACR